MGKHTDTADILKGLDTIKRVLKKKLDPLFYEKGLTTQQWQVLQTIHSHKDGLSTSQLAQMGQMTPSAISQCIEQLVNKHWVARHTDSGDKRRILHTIHPDADERIEQMVSQYQVSVEEFFKAFTPEELSTLAKLIQKIIG